MARKLLIVVLVLAVFLAAKKSIAACCTTINVAPNVSICLENGWQPILGGKLTTLDALGSGGKLLDFTKLSFAANLYGADNAVSGMMNIRRYPTETITQADILSYTRTSEEAYELVSEVDTAIQETIKTELPRRGIKILSWFGTTLDRLDGKAVFITSYRRLSAARKTVFVVRLVRYFNGPESFTLTLSHRENLGAGILKELNEVKESVRIR